MKKALVIMAVFILLATGVLTGCSGTKTAVTFSEPGNTVDVAANKEFTISLQANPTTGYDWQPVFDAAYLSQVKKEYKQDDHSGVQLVGSGGTDFFTFKALKAGQTQIMLTYYRAWETPKPEDKQQVYNITIK